LQWFGRGVCGFRRWVTAPRHHLKDLAHDAHVAPNALNLGRDLAFGVAPDDGGFRYLESEARRFDPEVVRELVGDEDVAEGPDPGIADEFAAVAPEAIRRIRESFSRGDAHQGRVDELNGELAVPGGVDRLPAFTKARSGDAVIAFA